MNARLLAEMPLDAILVCYEDGDDCPSPQAQARPACWRRPRHTASISAASFMIGDRWRDIEAGRRAGCRTVFIDCGYAEQRPDPAADHDAVRPRRSAADWILSQTHETEDDMHDRV